MSDYTKISCLLLIGVALYIAAKLYGNWLARRDAEWAERNPVVPDQQEIAAEHCAKVYIKRAKEFSRYVTAAESKGGTHD